MAMPERAVRNSLLIRGVNERINGLSDSWFDDEARELLCECGDENCTQALRLTAGDYEAVRRDEAQFVVAPGHELIEVEDVVAEHEGWTVVRKRGEAAAIAAESDPRSP